MVRSVLTGWCVAALLAGSTTIALADPMSIPGPSLTTSTVSPRVESDDVAAPTIGADLAMWNVGATADENPHAVRPLTRLQRLASGIVNRTSSLASSLTRSAMRFIGVPYVFGGTSTTGFDCSAYVQHVFRMHGVTLPRTADAQFDVAHAIRTMMRPGDLVFFHTYAPGVSHVGIYLGHDRFIHASSSRGVAVSSLHDSYWAARYVGARRVVGT